MGTRKVPSDALRRNASTRAKVFWRTAPISIPIPHVMADSELQSLRLTSLWKYDPFLDPFELQIATA